MAIKYCPVCDNVDQSAFSVLSKDHRFPAVRCGGCGLGIESVVYMSAVSYEPDTYDHNRNDGVGAARFAKFNHDSGVAALRLAQLADALPKWPGFWVDVGCENTSLLTVLRRRKWEVLGVEAVQPDFNPTAVPIKSFVDWVAAPPPATVVSFNDVIEHLLDPVDALKTAAKAVSTSLPGYIVIEVPDLDSTNNFDKWKHRRITTTLTEHIYHFSEKSLKVLLERHLPGFTQVHIARPVSGRLQVVWRNPGSGKERT